MAHTSPGLKFIDHRGAERRERLVPESGVEQSIVLREYFGRSDEIGPGPQGFLVEVLPPHSISPAHFHSTDQFQVFLPSSGAWYQRSRLDHPALHFTDAYSTYGPFGSEDEAMSFFTLRPTASAVTGYMPAARDKLVRRGRRNIYMDLGPYISDDQAPGTVVTHELIPPHEDGLAAYMIKAGPSASVSVPEQVADIGEGQYICVLHGSVAYNGESYSELSLGWCPPGQTITDIEDSSNKGFILLSLHMPILTTRDLLIETLESTSS